MKHESGYIQDYRIKELNRSLRLPNVKSHVFQCSQAANLTIFTDFPQDKTSALKNTHTQ